MRMSRITSSPIHRLIVKFFADLRKDKYKNGTISFEAEEVKLRLGEDAVPVEVYVKERKDAHMLTEDFMLLANKKVATFIHKKSKSAGNSICLSCT